MKIVRYGFPVEEYSNIPSPRIFLLGPTVRGHQQHLQPSWRLATIELFRERSFNGTLIVPEFEDIRESDKGRRDIPIWEYEGIKVADVRMLWVPRTRELIGLTTNFEMGYWMIADRKRMVYGRPDDAYRIDYLDILWHKDAMERGFENDVIYNTLSSTVDAALELASRA